MQSFIFCLFMVWTVLFGLVFFMAVPDENDIIIRQQQFKLKTAEAAVTGGEESSKPLPSLTPIPCLSEIPPPQEPPPVTEFKENEQIPIPILKDDPPIKIQIQGGKELPEIEDESNKVFQEAFEDRLVRVLVKINIAACKGCSKDDKRIILQLKMMQALLDGKPKAALQISKELDKYIQTAREPLKIKPTPIKKEVRKDVPQEESMFN
jgi:hypothetical protein